MNSCPPKTTTERPRILGALLLAAFTTAGCSSLPPSHAISSVEIYRTGDYSEGVVLDREGNLYFSHGKVITKVPVSGPPFTWAETGAPNGHKILADGSHLVCDGPRHAVLRLDADGNFIGNAATTCNGKALRGPNDLCLDPGGGFYFSDPGNSSLDNQIGTVHYVDLSNPDSSTNTHLVAEGLAYPNGIVLSHDGKTLFLGESPANRILVIEVLGPQSWSKPTVFASLPTKGEGQSDNQPDGMCLDAAGNLYVAHYGMRRIQVLSPDGELLRSYDGGNSTTSNCCFGGPRLDQLFVTGGDPGALFRLDLGVRGLDIRPR